MQLKGRTMLKVVGILYIVFAGISIVGGLMLMLGGGMFATTGDLGVGVGAIAVVGGLVIIISSALGLVAGILGVKFCNRADKAQVCFVMGIILVVLAAISLISSLTGDSSVFSALIGLVLPILYTLGAYWNKQSGAQMQGLPKDNDQNAQFPQ